MRSILGPVTLLGVVTSVTSLALSGAYCYMKAKQASSKAPASAATTTPNSSPFLNANRYKSK